MLAYENVMPGSLLLNRLQDLGYRTRIVTDTSLLSEEAEREKPLLILADLHSRKANVCAAVGRLKRNPATAHIPVIAFAADNDREMQHWGQLAGATMVVTYATIQIHLREVLAQALAVE